MDLMDNAARRAGVYRQLAAYYAGDLSAGEQGTVLLGEVLGKTISVPAPTEEDMYDFNRLFVGPQKLLAPPLESYYRNEDHLPMQAETMAVRAAYGAVGIELKAQNKIPDDHAQFEFFFAACLLEAVSKYPGQEQGELAAVHYRKFMQEHLLCWIFDHLQAVEEHSSTSFCREMAKVIRRFMQWEKEAVSHEV